MAPPPPVVTASVPVPPATETTVVSVSPVSTSATESAFPLPAENTSGVSSLVVCATGFVFTGASFTAVTLIVTVSVSFSVPAPSSVVLIVRVA